LIRFDAVSHGMRAAAGVAAESADEFTQANNLIVGALERLRRRDEFEPDLFDHRILLLYQSAPQHVRAPGIQTSESFADLQDVLLIGDDPEGRLRLGCASCTGSKPCARRANSDFSELFAAPGRMTLEMAMRQSVSRTPHMRARLIICENERS